MICYLENDEILIAGPDLVGVVGSLFNVTRHPGVWTLQSFHVALFILIKEEENITTCSPSLLLLYFTL